MKRIKHIFWAVLLLAGPLPAIAADGMLNAVSFLPVPSGASVMVEIYDDSDQNIALKNMFEQALREKGYTVSEDGRLVLSFETRGTEGTWTGGGPNRLIEIANDEDHTGTKAPDVRLNLFNSNRGGLLNKKRDPGITQVAASEYRIDANIVDRQEGRRLWEAWSIAEVGAADDPTLHSAMVKPIVSGIGQTIRQMVFPLY